jgi:hypothetical protein
VTRQQVAGAPGLVDGLGDRLAPLVPAAQMLRGSEFRDVPLPDLAQGLG